MATYNQIDHKDDHRSLLDPQNSESDPHTYTHFDAWSPLKAQSASILSFYDSTDIIESEIQPPHMSDDSLTLQIERRRKVFYWLQVSVTILLIVLVIMSWVYFSYWYEWTESYFALLRAQPAWFAPICYIGTC